MNKKVRTSQAEKKVKVLCLNKETLRCLEASELPLAVAAGPALGTIDGCSFKPGTFTCCKPT